jgi:DNA-binding transcriptional ArsR family regulator
VAIRIRFPAEEQPTVELTSYPLAELALSLHVVADPRMQPELAPFVRRARSRLPKDVARELAELAFLLGPPAPAPFAFPEGPPLDVPEALAAISAGDEDLQWTLSMHLDGTVPEHLRGRNGACTNVLDQLRRDPEAVAGRLLQLFSDYWTHAFSLEWSDVKARLRLAQAEAELQLAGGGLGSLLASTTRRARLNGDGIAITPTIPAEIEVPLQADGRMPVVISLYSSPWVITRITPAAGLVLPAPGADRRVTSPSIELVQGLDAIADPTRLTLLRLVAGRPRSTRELANLLELSEAAVSKHLRRLADAQLVRGERQGYYVLYRLLPERAVAASEALLDFLRVSSDSPAG